MECVGWVSLVRCSSMKTDGEKGRAVKPALYVYCLIPCKYL